MGDPVNEGRGGAQSASEETTSWGFEDSWSSAERRAGEKGHFYVAVWYGTSFSSMEVCEQRVRGLREGAINWDSIICFSVSIVAQADDLKREGKVFRTQVCRCED